MATVNQQDDEQQQGGQPNPTPGTSAPTGSGTGVGVGTAQAPQVKQNQAPQNNQGYTDVASYLSANQQGGNQLGQQVSSNLSDKYNTTKSGIDTSAGATNQQVQSGYIPENTQLIQQVASDPFAAANDSSQLSAFQGQLNDTYGGPTSWADYGTQQGKVNEATQYGSLLNAPGGKNVLIQDVENKLNPGQTGQGINSLDTLLFGGNQNAVQQAQSAAQPIQTLNDYINQQNTAIGQNIGNAQNAAAQTSQNALNAFTGDTGVLTNLNQNINQNTASQLSQAQALQAKLQADIGNLYGGQKQQTDATNITGYGGSSNPWYNTTNYNVGNLDAQDLQALGMTQDQWNALQGQMQRAGTSTVGAGARNFGANSPTSQIDLSQYLNMQDPTQAITNATTATPEQYQQMAAIQKLLGAKTPQNMAINPLEASQAGTYNPNNLNTFHGTDALTQAQQVADQEKQAADEETAALVSGADAAHYQSKHTGIGNAIKNAVSHPGTLAAVLANPATWASNATRVLQGREINPKDISLPGAKVIAPAAGAVVGGIYGGPMGALSGASAGQALGGTLQGLGGQSDKKYAHGGEVEEYLDKRK